MTKDTKDDWALQDNEELDDYIKRIYHLSPDTKILSVDVYLSNLKDQGISFPIDKIPSHVERDVYVDLTEKTLEDGLDLVEERLAKDIITGDVLFSITVKDKNGNVQHLDASMGNEWEMDDELK